MIQQLGRTPVGFLTNKIDALSFLKSISRLLLNGEESDLPAYVKDRC